MSQRPQRYACCLSSCSRRVFQFISNLHLAIEPTITALWSHFRIILFCVTSIFKLFAEVLPDRPDLDASEPLFKLFLTLRNMHFVTARFGSEGFKAWQSVISGCCAWFHTHARRQIKMKPDDVVSTLVHDMDDSLYSRSPFLFDSHVCTARACFHYPHRP